MNVIRDIKGYETSTDYEALWELAQRRGVICTVQAFDDTPDLRDVCQTIYEPKTMAMAVSSRGCGHVYVLDGDKAEFVKQCEKAHLEWIQPIFRGDECKAAIDAWMKWDRCR